MTTWWAAPTLPPPPPPPAPTLLLLLLLFFGDAAVTVAFFPLLGESIAAELFPLLEREGLQNITKIITKAFYEV